MLSVARCVLLVFVLRVVFGIVRGVGCLLCRVVVLMCRCVCGVGVWNLLLVVRCVRFVADLLLIGLCVLFVARCSVIVDW